VDKYVFGKHTGDLPTHLVGQGDPDNQVRAMVRLDGPDHDVFYALIVREEQEQQDTEAHLSVLSEAGTTESQPFNPCLGNPTCEEVVAYIGGKVTFMPPYRCLLFILVEADGTLEVLRELVDDLGEEAVAAVTDGSGRFIVELGAEDWGPLEDAHKKLEGASNVKRASAHRADGSALLRA
jgi:hypothetical protein